MYLKIKGYIKSKIRKAFGLSLLDWYILSNFMKTFFFSISLILAVVVVVDVNEKIDDFLSPEVSLYEIFFDYYASFIPYYANVFSPLFVFISVIFFTTKLADNSEIIAIQAGGQSFKKLLKPYFIGALIIAVISGLLTNFIVPPTTKKRLDFENKYIHNSRNEYVQSVHVEVEPNTVFSLQGYDALRKKGYSFVLETFKGRDLVSRMTGTECRYDTLGRWSVLNYRLRYFDGLKERDEVGYKIDTVIALEPKDFTIIAEDVETLTTPKLKEYIVRQTERGVGNAKFFAIELHKRYANICFAFILTFIGVILSLKKRKNGMGLHLAFGLMLSFVYIGFMMVVTTFAITGNFPTWLAAWLPNIVYSLIGILLWFKVSK